MRFKKLFSSLSKFELILWLSSVAVVIFSFAVSGGVLHTIASLIGVTALIFVAKGMVAGQILTIIFSVFYGIVSFHLRYYGEMITYLCMTSPMALCATVSWIKNPYKDSNEVKIRRLQKSHFVLLFISAAAVTALFYFILRTLGNANLIISTISVTTSFIASVLTFLRSPFYALGYAANDVVLIILWTIAAIQDISSLPMVLCFIMFLLNDLYGFFNWKRMQQKQEK